MDNINIMKNIREQKKLNIVSIFIISILIFGLYVVRLSSINIKYDITEKDLRVILNLILATMGIISCLLSYNSNKKEEIFIISLMYIMFGIDIIYSKTTGYLSDESSKYYAILTSFIRLCIVYIAVGNLNKFKNFIINNKSKVLIIVSIITFASIYIEYYYMLPYSREVLRCYELYNVLLALIYIWISMKFFKKSFVKNDYIYAVIGSSTLIFSMKSICDLIYIVTYSRNIALIGYSTIILGFIIYIIGLFIELSESIKKNRELDEQRSLFIKIIDENKHSNVIICDENYYIYYKNKKAIESLSEVSYIDDIDIDIGNKLDIVKLFENVLDMNVIESELNNIGSYRKNLYVKDSDSILDFSIQLIEINNKKYKVVTVKDISTKYKLEKALLEYELVKKEDVVKSEFFSNISHELRTPLNVLYSTNQLLDSSIDKSNFKDIYIKYSECININCKRMLRLINNIVDITKLDVGFKSPNFKNYNIVKVIEEMTMSVISYAMIKDIEIVFDTEVEDINIKCDLDMLERIVLNLLSNAIKFSDKGSTILVKTFNIEGWVGFKVIDNGIGIDPIIQAKIFDRFVQGDKSMRRKKEGSGIGLSLVKSFVELMNGKIYVESDGKAGSEFTVLLPNKLCNEDGNTKEKDYNVDLQRIQLELSDIYELFEQKYNENI